jgi:hypothetical protein
MVPGTFFDAMPKKRHDRLDMALFVSECFLSGYVNRTGV